MVVFLLLILFFVRAHNILELPVFVDESLHILRGRVVWRFSDLGESLLPKKLLYYYWIGLFELNSPAAAWLARTASALLGMIGGSLCYALARLLFDRRAGLLALALYTFTPMLVFFERLALADSLAASLGTAITISSIRLARFPTSRCGAITGALIGLAVLAKLTALPFAALPVLALVLWGHPANLVNNFAVPNPAFPPSPREAVREGAGMRAARGLRRPYGMVVVSCLLVLSPSLAYVTLREITGTADRVVVEQALYTTAIRPAQIQENLDRMGEAFHWLITPGLVPLFAVSWLILFWRRQSRTALYLCAAILLPWLTILLVSAELSTRYLLLGVPPLLVIVAGAFPSLRNGKGRGWALIILWLVLFALPFAYRSMTDPSNLHLPARDKYEYLTSAASGYGLRDLAADLPHLLPNRAGRIVVIGLLPSCHSLPLYGSFPNAVDLKCPLFMWDTRQKQALAGQIVEWSRTESVLYLALDEIGDQIDLDALPITLDLLAVYPRPQNGATIQLYRVTPGEM